ncbi:tetratricopeptide repeat protein [Salidesulfovibrio onnuriiensis]|uniref:tetratricopeptide repeat protein n=1 Tax=Salidesulfovibrio onnuriiensis TaxID=2583823 RepID=UPI00202B3558|nr:tetratricopeptide repeat protein [Salidesulfovibrio onnuriiensis]
MAEEKVDQDSVLDTDEMEEQNAPQAAAPPAGNDAGFAMPEAAKHIKIQGLFSSQQVDKVGTGTTTRKTVSKTFWYAEERDDGMVEIQPLNVSNVPSGSKTEIAREDLIAKFNPEPEYYQQKVFPKLKELNDSLKRAEDQRKNGAFYSAEFEFKQALDVDEDNVRANFGLGLTYMERGEPTKANDMFHRLVGLEAAFSPEHKHLFNEFGINLRKSNLFDQSIEYYGKAIETADYEDENLHYNMARAYFGKGEKELCAEQLQKALQINPDFEEAAKFLEYIKKQAD